ncbi:ABC transporter substrate-binding protein [Brenneria goodwinii]|uniref:ABC transporter substrate-binding protein n=1 Tax=Brenneria goodwinii TaxID=1109412 RepID=UPI000F0E4234|nr:ABC transporter substrate-binding protein [Brenneria goodwinii]RLM24629.1 hypothetical protein BIY28_04175 [Brenneria goodwinii]
MRNVIPNRLIKHVILLMAGASLLLSASLAWAEGRIRIAYQFGINELMLHVAKDQRLIEKRGEAQGLKIDVEWVQLAGGAAVSAHFANAPFQNEALKHPNVHKVVDSYELFGGPQTGIVVMGTQKFHDENPQTYMAFLHALEDAAAIVNSDRSAAASAYLRSTGSRLSLALVEEVVADPSVTFTVVPENSLKLLQFLHRVGQIKHKPKSWRDYFFPEIHDRDGS